MWKAKRAALETLWRVDGRPSPLDGATQHNGLADWSTYCALAERHGGRWSRWSFVGRNALMTIEENIRLFRTELIPILKKEKGVKLIDWNPLGHQFVIRFNHVVKPFDNPKMRLALGYAIDQKEYLTAAIGDVAEAREHPHLAADGVVLLTMPAHQQLGLLAIGVEGGHP